MSCRLFLSSCPDRASAERIAATLLDRRLAACVSLLPGAVSVYRWQQRVERSEEVLLQIKSTADCEGGIRQVLAELHPYELPELIAVEVVSGLPAYLDWVRAETAAASPRASSPPTGEPT